MECISISFKSAPEEIRRIFVFTQEEKKQLLEQAEQAVLLATCNRTEIYATGKESLFRYWKGCWRRKAVWRRQSFAG